MKKLSLLLLLSVSFLSACQDDKAQETAVNTDTTEAKEAATTAPETATAEAANTETASTDESTGESIHQANCTRCHGVEVYTRADRQVTSLDALKSRVKMCDSQLETSLFPEDMDKVVNYLNETHYTF